MSPQCETLLEALRRGERLTMLTALSRYGIGALSQRVGDLKRAGHPIASTMIRTTTGKHVAEYHYEKQVPQQENERFRVEERVATL